MKVATRINVLFVSIALLLALALTWFTTWREYHLALERTVDKVMAIVQGHPDLQVEIYQRDATGLTQLLALFLETPTVVAAAARDGLGLELAQHSAGSLQPPFGLLRGEASTADTSLVGLNGRMEPAGTGLWAALIENDVNLYLTVPVFTSVNAAQQGLTAYDFFVATTKPGANSSLRVIGYVQVNIAAAALLDGIWSLVSWVFYVSLILIVFTAAVIAFMGRRLKRDFSLLARLADDVASGKQHEPVKINASGEIRDIAEVLNNVIGGFSSFKKEADVGQRLLTMKVDERTSQLSQREQELCKATEEISETRTRLQHLAYYDSLTALPNRRLFTEQLSLLMDLNKRNGHTLALLFINLDNFKRINDSLGHSAGDQVLLEVGKRLSDGVRESDRVAHYVDSDNKIDVSRLGGDEFTVVLNQLESVDAAGQIVKRLLDSLLRPMTIADQDLVVSPSIGVAVAPRDGADVEGLLKAAGIAMYHAKHSVRDTVLFYDKEMDDASAGILKLESDLRLAVERRELVLHYQPQVNTGSGAVAGAEALVRWQHPEHGLLPPFRFIPLAEEIGVIGELGDWVLAEVCRQLKEFDARELLLPRVSVNVSAFQLTPAFAQRVAQLLQEHGLAASRLDLGLTEDILTDQDRGTQKTLEELRAQGVHLSVDDFGTGSAPLNYLSRYSLDELKIDRSFVIDCEKLENRARLLTAIIAMANSLGLDIVAEGVENREQCRLLMDQGVQVIQGYLLSKPVPADELQVMLAPWHFLQQLQAVNRAED